MHFMIIIKHVIKDAISQSDQKMMTTKINMQNFKICEMMKILHIEHSKKNTQDNIKIDILIINMIILQQTNILIQKKLILQKILYNVKIFHRNCLIVHCY